MNLGGRIGRAETVIFPVAVRDVPCALHVLAIYTPTPPGVEVWEGGCFECGAAILYHFEPATPERERRLYRELYPVGVKSVSLGTSRRYIAWLAWLRRQPPRPSPPARDPYARALEIEANRRTFAAWSAFWETAPVESREWAAELFAEDLPLEALEAIIWSGAYGDSLTQTT